MPESAAGLLLLGRLANWNSRLCRWLPTQGGGIGGGKDTFDNQALNPLHNFCVRGFPTLASCRLDLPAFSFAPGRVDVADCRSVSQECDVWTTDPPYADYVVYHELSEFFLAWYERRLPHLFPGWTTGSRRGQAVQGTDQRFRRGMADCYRNLTRHMPADGVQVLLFTHQSPTVWADLTLILWEAALRVTAAWCVRTETKVAGIKQGRHVPGTVVLVLRRQTETKGVILESLYPELEGEVRRQLQAFAEGEAHPPDDVARQMAGCAAAVRLLTRQPIADLDDDPQRRQATVAQLIRAACP
jgi:hypothetical protein